MSEAPKTLEELLALAKGGAFSSKPEQKNICTETQTHKYIDTHLPLIYPQDAPKEKKEVYADSKQRLDQEQISICYIKTEAEANAALIELNAYNHVIGFDIETAPHPNFKEDRKGGLDPYRSWIRLAQFYSGGNSVYVFDLYHLKGFDIWKHLPRKLVAHNAKFETKFLLHKEIEFEDLDCTQLQANALTNEHPSLEKLAQERLGWTISKEEQTSDWGNIQLTESQISYAALDAVIVKKLFDIQERLIQECGRDRIYSLMKSAIKPTGKMELSGLGFDCIKHAHNSELWQEKLNKAESELHHILGPAVSPSSTKQLTTWLESKLSDKDLKEWPRTESGLLSTSHETLEHFSHLDFVKPLFAYKEAAKRVSTYGAGYTKHINPVTGRIHADFMLAGAVSGRFTCTNPNLQQIPQDKGFRSLFSAASGRKLIVADFSQQELRISALLTHDEEMLKAYKNKEDLHRKTAGAVAGVPPEQVTKAQRQLAKALNFGLIYGCGAARLVEAANSDYGVKLTLQEATEAKKKFFKQYVGLKYWQDKHTKTAERILMVSTTYGRVLDFAKNGFRYTDSLNFPVQGAGAEILMATMARLDKALLSIDAKLVLVVHDEIVVEAAEQDAEAAKELVIDCMVQGFMDIFPEAEWMGRDLVEAHIGPDWGNAKG